ncbi:MAG: hypothetical protein RMK30_08400 [Anaerolineae bacterium]|nr:hypothetical protein [Anaerolineae bacterium]MDW8102882.1 hypothetical protein [Anaerolineae bacterium]
MITQWVDESVLAKGKEIYLKLKDQLEANHQGEIVAIDVDSGEYFVGKTLIEVNDKAREKYLNKQLYFARIGTDAALALRVW